MTWFFAVLIVLAMGAVAVVASGRGASLGPSYDDRADVRLPADRPVTGDDLRALREPGRATLHAVLVATAFNESRFAPSEAVEVLEQGA